MTDFSVPSAFDAAGASSFQAPSDLDVSSIDRSIRTMNAIEQHWRLPSMPEEIKLDLAGLPGTDSDSLSWLLNGLDSDLYEQEEAQEDPTAGLSVDWDANRSRMDQFRVLVNEWRGELPPSEVSVDAVRQFKLDAIRRGYMEPPVDGRIDSTWAPELSRIRRDMLYDDIDASYAGNRAGAIPNETVFEQLGKWTSPSGLLAAATELDLFWDFGAINKEWSSWGSKWRAVADSSGPLDFAKNLVDAVTGPLDDIVLPAANLFLLGSGVGAVANLGRIGAMSSRLANGGRFMRGIYSATTLMRPQALTELGQSSLLARTLSNRSGSVAQALGGAMTAWRDIPVVARVKQGVGLGMRTGFLSQAEDLLPGYQGGRSLADINAVDTQRRRLQEFGLRSPLATLPELMFAPTNIFNPGTFMRSGGEGLNLLSRTGQGFLAAGGTLPGRALIGGAGGAATGALLGDDTEDLAEGITIGALTTALAPYLGRTPDAARRAIGVAAPAVGAALVTDEVDPFTAGVLGAATGVSTIPLSSVWARVPNPGKWVGFIGDGLAHLDFRPISDDQRIGSAFHNGLRRWMTDKPDDLQRWDDAFSRTRSFRETFKEFYGLDDTSTDAAVTFVTLAAAIDHTAALQAGGRNSDQFLRFKTKLVSQIQQIETDDEFLVENVARLLSDGEPKRFEQLLSGLSYSAAREIAENHNRLAERTMRQLTSLDNVEDLLDNVDDVDPFNATAQSGGFGALVDRSANQGTGLGAFQAQSADQRMSALEAYVSGIGDTFGDWGNFSSHSFQIENWVNTGLLDDAEFLPVISPGGTSRRPRAEIYRIDHRLKEADDEVINTIVSDPLARTKTRKSLAPLARSQPSGTFALAKTGTRSKQFWEETELKLRDLIRTKERLDELGRSGGWSRLEAALQQSADGRRLHEYDVEDLKTFLSANGFNGKETARIVGVRKFMAASDLTDDDLRFTIDSLVDEHVGSPVWGEAGFDLHPQGADGQVLYGTDALKARMRQVTDKARRTAAEIDTDKLVASVRASRGDAAADDLAAQFAAVKDSGYKLVHGVEFMMPHKLMTRSIFRDHGVREANFATFGNFFSRRHPLVARAAQERRELASLAGAMNAGVDTPEIRQAHRDLRAILNDIQDPVMQDVENRHLLPFARRMTQSLKTGQTPVAVSDLTWNRNLVIDGLVKRGWEPHRAKEIFSAIRGFRNTEFKDLGLYALEAKVRSKNLNVSSLKWLSGASEGPSAFRMAAGAAVGGAVAADVGEDGTLDGSDSALYGALAGAGAALAGRVGVNRFLDIPESLMKAEQRTMFQVGDHLARWRDILRFSLSPIFEVSRFTEGHMLSKTGVPLRHADGTRVVMPTNLSPRSVKKRLGVEGWNQAKAEYSHLLRTGGHGDIDVVDDMVQRFSQVGIFGFNPQHWQIAAYAEMKKAGISAPEAFEHAIETFTYGIRGRSPAELSVNAVFFPFSFQKKALGHIAKFVNDDLGRSILITDGLKAYEALNEKYDLNTWFSDHVPALEQLQRLNVLAYGVSPGRFGGINAQALETLGKTALLFTPMAFHITNDEDATEVDRLMRSLVPAWNDINWMIQETKDTKSLIQAGQLPRAQVQDGYNEWNNYRQEVSAWLRDNSFTWYDLHNKPFLASQKRAYEAKLAELNRKYPAWVESRRQAIFNKQATEMAREDLLREAQTNPNAGSQAVMMLAFESKVQEVKGYLNLLGVSVDGPDGWLDAPPEAADALIEEAVRLYNQNPAFLRIWNVYFLGEFGPLEARV